MTRPTPYELDPNDPSDLNLLLSIAEEAINRADETDIGGSYREYLQEAARKTSVASNAYSEMLANVPEEELRP